MVDEKPTGDAWRRFGPELRRRREDIGMSAAKAASRAGVGGSTWTQVEAGHAKRGGQIIDYPPTRQFIIKASRHVGWPTHEALAFAGFDPTVKPDEQEDDEVMPTRIVAMWNRLTKQQQLAFEWWVRLALDPHATYTAPPPKVDHSPPFSSPERTRI